jgi:hypothetical protein
VDILAVLKYWIAQGKLAANATIGQVDYGWETCSTNGATLSFAVNGYTLSMGRLTHTGSGSTKSPRRR